MVQVERAEKAKVAIVCALFGLCLVTMVVRPSHGPLDPMSFVKCVPAVRGSRWPLSLTAERQDEAQLRRRMP